MKPRQGYVLAALWVTLAALCINVLAVALPFWQITAVSTGDVALGLWSTCFLTDGWSECWSHSSVEVWLLIVRTVMMMALVLLVLVVVALCIYLLDISWKEILHAVTVISLLMVVLLIIVGLLIYGLNSPMEYLHVSFCLALIAAILALIAAILLLIGCQCCKCYQRERKQENLHHIQTTDRESRMDTSLVIEREPTQAWPAEDTKMTRRASQFSWNSSAKVQPESAEHTEYIRTASQISRPRSTPVTMFHEEKDDKGCKCCRFCCWFTYCKCCHCEKRERHVETKSTLENTTCTYCSHTRPIGIDKSTSSTSLQQDVMATPNTLLQYESRQQTNIKQINGNNHGNAHHVMMGVNYQNRTPVKNDMSTCMTPEHEKGERNRKWNHHKTSLIHCGRVVKAIAFDANLGLHAPCPFSVYCCRCKHTIQAKTLETDQAQLNNIRNEDYVCDCQLGDTNLCDKCIAKRKIKDKPKTSHQRSNQKTVKTNERVYHSNAESPLKQSSDDRNNESDNGTNRSDQLLQQKHIDVGTRPAKHPLKQSSENKNSTNRSKELPQQRHGVVGTRPSSNDDLSEYPPSDNDNDFANDRLSEHSTDKYKEDTIDDEKEHDNYQDEYNNSNDNTFQKQKPTNASRSSIENDTKPKGKPKTRETQYDKVEKQAVDDRHTEKPVTSSSKDSFSGTKPSEKPGRDDQDIQPQGKKQQKKPRILSYNENQVENKTAVSKRPKSEADASSNASALPGDTSKPKTKKKHKWVPPKWKSHF